MIFLISHLQYYFNGFIITVNSIIFSIISFTFISTPCHWPYIDINRIAYSDTHINAMNFLSWFYPYILWFKLVILSFGLMSLNKIDTFNNAKNFPILITLIWWVIGILSTLNDNSRVRNTRLNQWLHVF